MSTSTLIESAIMPVRDFIMTINNSAASLLKDFRVKFDIQSACNIQSSLCDIVEAIKFTKSKNYMSE